MISLERRIALLLGIIFFVSYAYFFQGGGWNPNSRFDLTRALAEQHTLAIDDYVGNTGDWAYFNGHYYTNKAPGLSLLAVPVWIATDILLPSTTTLDARAWWTNVFVNALPASLLGVCLFVTLGWLGVSSIHARVGATLAYGLGTLAFPYATAFYAHQPAAVFGFASFAALVRAKQTDDKYAWALGAGALAGMSVIMEMSCLIIPVVLGLWLAIGRDVRRLGFFILGGVLLAAVLMLYGWMAFHDPLARWTRWANPNVEVRVNGNLFGWPSPDANLWTAAFRLSRTSLHQPGSYPGCRRLARVTSRTPGSGICLRRNRACVRASDRELLRVARRMGTRRALFDPLSSVCDYADGFCIRASSVDRDNARRNLCPIHDGDYSRGDRDPDAVAGAVAGFRGALSQEGTRVG